MAKNTLLKDSKWYTENVIDVDFLKAKETVEKHGSKHTPIAHSLILESFRQKATENGLVLVNEQGALKKDGERFMYVAEVEDKTDPDFHLSVGFRNHNDRSLSFSGMLGSSIFCCANGVCHGIVIPSRQRHTEGNYGLIGDKVSIIFDRFLADRQKVVDQIQLLRNTKLTDDITGRFIFELHKSKAIGNTNIGRIVEAIVNPEAIMKELDKPTLNDKNDDSCFRLMNAYSYITTHVIKTPNARTAASQLCNNTLMKVLNPGFQPIGDVDATTDDEANVIDVSAIAA